MEQIRQEPLGGGMSVFVSDRHRFSTDTILLAHFSRPKSGKKCADLGAGCGTISLLWLRDNRDILVTAVELQDDACALARRGVAHNGLEERMEVVHADLRDLKGKLDFGSYDLVACNPPYKPEGCGVENPDNGRLTARHETACTLADICQAAGQLLQFGGRFCICQRPERLADAIEEMRRADIEPKRLRLVQQRPAKAPKLFLLEGRRGGKRGFLNVLPTLFIEDGSGGFSQEMLTIYGDYKTEH